MIPSLALKQDDTGTLAVTAQPLSSPWGPWTDQSQQPLPYMMDISGLIQSQGYDQQAVTSAAMARAFMAPQYTMPLSYTTTSTTGMLQRQAQPQQSLYGSYSYNTTGNVILPAVNYLQRRPQSQMMNPPLAGLPSLSSSRPITRQNYMPDQQTTDCAYIKPEPEALSSTSSWENNNQYMTATISSTTSSDDVNFGTDVDTLMRAIQSKIPPESPAAPQSSPVKPPSTHPSRAAESSHEEANDDPKKRYECHIGDCRKAFFQKTHLEIHIRAHTGVKPYTCRYPGCSQTFSQLGNLKTHERRHSGERPYSCELCGKSFAQRGNVRAHRSVHNASKPFKCKLDACNKTFTQLGNLKSHQNKFHYDSLRELTAKFQSGGVEGMGPEERELWEYFRDLYKNSNKGIKGRGKGRKVASAPPANGNSLSLYAGKSTPFGNEMQTGYAGYGRREYDYDFDAASNSGSVASHSGSSTDSIYGVDASDAYEGEARELAFGDRMY